MRLATRLIHHPGAVCEQTGAVSPPIYQVSTFRQDAVDRLRLARIAPSLGAVETLVEQVALMGYWDVPRPERERLGMADNVVRLSLGIEESADIIADLEQALAGA